jgi:hypothetical protein
MTALGAGHKVFASGEVLYAEDVQEYLMDQSVMVFTGTSNRNSELAVPGDGQVCYLTDTNVLQVYKPTVGWVTIGLQSEIRDALIATYMQAV